MYIKQLTINLEIGLLTVFIDLLSDSRLFQDIFRWFLQKILTRLIEIREAFNPKLATRWSLTGLSLGLLIGLLIGYF
jgi:hypothetical protein